MYVLKLDFKKAKTGLPNSEVSHSACFQEGEKSLLTVIYGEKIGPSCLLAIAADSAFALRKKKEKNLVGFFF